MSKAEQKSSGLSDREQIIMDHLIEAVREWHNLPGIANRPQDTTEFILFIHQIQSLLAIRVLRREHKGWN